METVLDRFLRYVQINTQSDEKSGNHPSTPGQIELARMLEAELQEFGVSSIKLNDKGYLVAELPANTDKDLPTVGFIAHLDTSPDVSGADVKPQVFLDYDGQDLILNRIENQVLKTEDYPELKGYAGQTIITSDGTTLLGADDKAGVAAIMTAIATIINAPELKHGRIVIGFTPDEEIGLGADFFDVLGFGADFAYTVDGGPCGELEYENFNAAMARVDVHGINVHPGSAYMRMKNALSIAMEFNFLLPSSERPEYTRDYEGFFHLTRMEGSVDSAKMVYIIRDHDRNKFEQKKTCIENCAAILNSKYGDSTIQFRIIDQYYNMKEKIEPVFYIVDLAQQAMVDSGISPQIKPIRGGTDGARLSFMGLPCPNLFTGGHNFHSRHEFISLESMEAIVGVIIRIIELIAAGDTTGL